MRGGIFRYAVYSLICLSHSLSYIINMKKYVSGIRPSGKLHLGNYLGAIKLWKTLQLDDDAECIFFVANLHGQYSLEDAYDTIDELGKAGIAFPRLQSSYKNELLVLQHELSFYANTSRLDNMTQYKEKGGTLALYAYPVLMAADILYHEATHVPIGDDQKQHLELVRELARKNGRIEPEAVINPIGSRIMDLKDPSKKMSKSNPNPDGIIYLCDSADEIARKIKGAVSTPAGIMNLTEICRALGDGTISASVDNYSGFKIHVTDLLITELGA